MKKQTMIRWVRRGLAGLLVLLSCLVLFYGVERYRGAKAWQETKASLEARGEIVEYEKLIPPPIPEELNLAAIPLFQNLDWQGTGKTVEKIWQMPKPPGDAPMPQLPTLYTSYDSKRWRGHFLQVLGQKDPGPRVEDADIILKGLEPLSPLLDEVQKAMRERPLTRWPICYEKLWGSSVPHCNVVLDLGKAYCLRALARASRGEGDRALEDLGSAFRLAEAAGQDSFLIGTLVQASIDALGAGTAHQLLRENRFSAKQWEELQKLLQKQSPMESLANGLRWERAGFCAMVLKLKAEDFATLQSLAYEPAPITPQIGERWAIRSIFWLYPRGWMDADRALCAATIQADLLDHLDVPRGYVDLRAIREDEQQIMTRVKSKALPRHLLFALAYPGVSSASQKIGEVQASLALGAVGCALERHRLQQGGYPESLEALRPGFMASLPPDPLTGENPGYQRDADGKGFQLHAVGLNLKDDGGVPADRKTKEQEGDWVLRIRR
jgi:hypothetical protein